MLLDSTQANNHTLWPPSGSGGTAFNSKDLSFVPQVNDDLAVRRWTRHQASLTCGILTSEVTVMMPLTSEHGSGLEEMIYVKISQATGNASFNPFLSVVFRILPPWPS